MRGCYWMFWMCMVAGFKKFSFPKALTTTPEFLLRFSSCYDYMGALHLPPAGQRWSIRWRRFWSGGRCSEDLCCILVLIVGVFVYGLVLLNDSPTVSIRCNCSYQRKFSGKLPIYELLGSQSKSSPSSSSPSSSSPSSSSPSSSSPSSSSPSSSSPRK